MSKEQIPYMVENEDRDTFTFYIKGTKPYLELQQRIDKAIEVLKEIEGCDAYIKEVLEILGDKENE